MTRQKGTFSSFIIRLAIVATALSVAVMIVAVGIVTGFQHSVRGKLFSFWGHVHVVPHDANPSNIISAKPIQYDPVLRKNIAAMPHVTQVMPYAMRNAIIQANGEMDLLKLKGVPANYQFGQGIQFSGGGINFKDTGYSKDIILSQTMADRLNITAGNEIMIYFMEPSADMPRVRKLKVAGLFHTGMDEIDHYFGVCDLRLLQRLNGWTPQDINGYQVDLDNSFLADTMASQIYTQYVEPPLYTESINEIYQNIIDWLNMQNVNVRILIIIMSIVSIINLSAALIILIVDRARMVALFKALGMPFGDIRTIFISLAGLIGGIGVLLGTVLSLVLAWAQQRYGFLHLPEETYYMSKVPISIVWWHVVVIDVVSLVVCMASMALPTLYIKRIQPAKVLQFK